MRRSRRAAVLAVALVAVATAGAVTWHATRDTRPATPTPAQARSSAAKACADLADFERLVDRNAGIDEVKAALRRAERESDTAAGGDAAWYGLSGGVKSLRLALDANDGRAARVGIDVVRTECKRVAG